MRLILLGPPGAGKGTQAKELAKALSLPHISTGEILRQSVTCGTDLGKEAKAFMLSGALVPDALVKRMLEERLNQPDVKNGFILDGYPRNINQAMQLDELLNLKNMAINFVAYLDTSDAVIIQRLSGRLVCKTCASNFHSTNMPPKAKGICDNCGGALYQRDDDKIETIKNRIQVYKKEVAGLIDYYKAKQILHNICADDEAGLVLDKIINLAGEYRGSHQD